MTACLRLTFLDDDDGTGKLVVRAAAHGFAGEGAAHFDKGELEAFASSLEAFPLVGRPAIAGGFYDKAGSGEIEQEQLAIECYRLNARGHLGVRARLATEVWPETPAEMRHAVMLHISTTYEPLRRFAGALRALVRGEADEVVLDGD